MEPGRFEVCRPRAADQSDYFLFDRAGRNSPNQIEYMEVHGGMTEQMG